MVKKLQTKLVFILVLLTVISMAIVGSVLVSSVTSFYGEDFNKQVNNFFNESVMEDLVEAANADPTGQELYRTLSLYSSRLGIDTYRNVYILDSNAKFINGSNPDLGVALEKTQNMLQAINGSNTSATPASESYMDYAKRVDSENGNFIIYIKDTKQEVRDLSWVMIIIIIKTVVLAVFIAVVLSYFLAKTIAKPIQNITYGASKIANGDFSYKLDVQSKDEIGTLTETFNDMAKVLETTLENIEGERSKLSTIFLYMTDGVLAFGENGVLLHINEAAENMLATECVVNKTTFDDIFSTTANMQFYKMQALVEKTNYVLDLTVQGKTYKCDFAHFSSGVRDDGIIAVLHDVTEQEEIDRSRREFIANVSHELRTPLTNVKSYTETVMENADLPEDSKEKFLGVVINETDRMIRIVKDLLILSKLDSKKMELSMAPFSITQTMQRVYEAMQIEAQHRHQELTLNIGENIPYAMGDKERIEQVIVNIVSNAIKYTPDNGRIAMSCNAENGEIVIVVKDNGIGIPKRDVDHIFERFYRVDKARSREQGGTGLGLAIAKDIIEEHGGKIKIASVLNKGTTVWITLGIAQQQLEFKTQEDNK